MADDAQKMAKNPLKIMKTSEKAVSPHRALLAKGLPRPEGGGRLSRAGLMSAPESRERRGGGGGEERAVIISVFVHQETVPERIRHRIANNTVSYLQEYCEKQCFVSFGVQNFTNFLLCAKFLLNIRRKSFLADNALRAGKARVC